MPESALMIPSIDDESAGFWEGTAAGELRVQVCGACGHRRFPPRPMCPQCHSLERSWVAVEPTGTIWSFIVTHPPLLAAYAEFAPYNVIVVTLDVDPAIRMVGNLVHAAGDPLNAVDPSTVEIGAAVTAVYAPRQTPDGREVTLPYWVLR